MRRNRVIIRRSAVISPLGDDPVVLGQRLDAGETGIRRIADLAPGAAVGSHPSLDARVVGLTSFELQAGLSGDGPRFLAVLSALLSQIRRKDALEVDAIVLATHILKYEELSHRLKDCLSGDPALTPAGLKSEIRKRALECGYRLPDDTGILHFSTICSSGLSGLGLAFRRIRRGEWTRALVCSVDLVDTGRLIEMGALGVLSPDDDVRACRPFAADRGGMVCAGGAGLCLLETMDPPGTVSEDDAEAEILGHGQTSDAWRLTDGREDGAEVARAIRLSIEDAGLVPDAISLIKAHGTGTFLNDQLEYRALRQIFGDRLASIPLTALKARLGHSTEASGLVELIAGIRMLKLGRIFSTGVDGKVDPEFALNLIMGSEISRELDYILCNAIGFGGHNSSVVIGKAGNAPSRPDHGRLQRDRTGVRAQARPGS